MMKILDATTKKFIHFVDKACGLDNITLLNKNERGSDRTCASFKFNNMQ